MVFGSHANTRAMYSTPPWPSLAASMAAYRRRSFSDNHPKKRCIFSSISAEYTSMIDSLSQNLSCYKDTTAQACREVIHDHILRGRQTPYIATAGPGPRLRVSTSQSLYTYSHLCQTRGLHAGRRDPAVPVAAHRAR